MMRPRGLMLWAALLVAPTLTAQSAKVTIRFVAPAADALVSGPTKLAVKVEPPDRAGEIVRVTFSVDGRVVCAATAPPFECEWDAGREIVAHSLRAVASLANGERVVRTMRTRGLGHVERAEVAAIQLSVVVTDEHGKFVRQLPQDAFEVFEDDKRQAVTTFAAENIPLELVAAIDVSQSMEEAMADTKQAARTFLGALAPTDQVTLVAFNDNIFTLARRATDRAARAAAVERLAPWGGTSLHDVIIRGVDMLGSQPGRRALVLFSDGEDQNSRATMDAAVRRVEGSDVTIYTVGLGQATRVATLRSLLERLATLSGGRGLFPDRSEELEAAFGEIVQDLSNQYLLGYQPENQDRDGAWRRIDVRVRVPGKFNVRARQGYRLLPEGR